MMFFKEADMTLGRKPLKNRNRNTLHNFNQNKTGFMRNTAEVSQGLALVALESFTLCMTGSTFDSENCLLAELGIQSFVMPPSKFRVKSRA